MKGKQKGAESCLTFFILKAGASEINNLDCTFARMHEEDVLGTITCQLEREDSLSTEATYLGLQVAMDYSMVS